MTIREISTARLKEYDNNPRNNDLAVEKVKYSIERFGFLFPIVVDVNYVIVCGHTRVRASRELGLQSVPCIVADELTEEQINFFRLVDNKTSEYSDWDFEKLKEELSLVDLTLEENQLLLERFELSAEVFDIDVEQAEIKIPAFNFMGVNDKPKEPKPTVRTINSGKDADDDAVDDEETVEPSAPSADIATYNDFTADVTPQGTNIEMPETGMSEEPAAEPKKPKGVLPFCQFRFGDVAFFISQVELDRLNAKYSEYIDSGAILEGSFANHLLKGVEAND
jgi:hypothetical protein